MSERGWFWLAILLAYVLVGIFILWSCADAPAGPPTGWTRASFTIGGQVMWCRPLGNGSGTTECAPQSEFKGYGK